MDNKNEKMIAALVIDDRCATDPGYWIKAHFVRDA